jgi:hypothetical protein
MQMRSCAKWFCLSVVGVFALTGSASAAPKKKHKDKTEKAAPVADVEPEPVKEAKPKDVDALMDDSTKKKPAKPKAAEPEEKAEPEAADVGEPDAWERPPLEAEKPKKKKHVDKPEEKKGDGNNMNIGIVAGYGFATGSGFGGQLNPYGFGGGLQGDYELDNHLVLGVGGEFFVGESGFLNRAGGLGRDSAYARYVLAHALVGYNFWFGTKLILRPSIWVGAAIGLQPPDSSGGRNVWGILLAPGLSFHYLLGDNGWYLGADVRFSIPMAQANSSRTGLPILVTFGKRF